MHAVVLLKVPNHSVHMYQSRFFLFLISTLRSVSFTVTISLILLRFQVGASALGARFT